MKKMLIVAALMATTVMPVSNASAATMAATTPKMSPVCFFLPLLPDCMSAWKAEHDSMMSKMAAPAKTAMAAPKMMMTMPTCTKAAAGAGHLFDCKM